MRRHRHDVWIGDLHVDAFFIQIIQPPLDVVQRLGLGRHSFFRHAGAEKTAAASVAPVADRARQKFSFDHPAQAPASTTLGPRGRNSFSRYRSNKSRGSLQWPSPSMTMSLRSFTSAPSLFVPPPARFDRRFAQGEFSCPSSPGSTRHQGPPAALRCSWFHHGCRPENNSRTFPPRFPGLIWNRTPGYRWIPFYWFA